MYSYKERWVNINSFFFLNRVMKGPKNAVTWRQKKVVKITSFKLDLNTPPFQFSNEICKKFENFNFIKKIENESF